MRRGCAWCPLPLLKERHISLGRNTGEDTPSLPVAKTASAPRVDRKWRDARERSAAVTAAWARCATLGSRAGASARTSAGVTPSSNSSQGLCCEGSVPCRAKFAVPETPCQ